MTITLDGTLTDWTPGDRLETPQTAVSGYELYGRIEAGAFVVALKSAVAIGPDTTFWLNTDGDTSTGYRVWGSEVGAEFNVNIGPDGIPRLYTGADGQTFVSSIDFALSPDGTVLEMRLPQTAIGSPEKISIHADVNNSVFLPNNYSGPGYVVQPVVASSFDGLLTEWAPDQRLDSATTGHEGYALYGRVDPANFVIALKSDVVIGAGTTFWLNTDGNSDTGYKIWGWAGGAEYNVNIGDDGIARLYTGAAGDQFVSEIDFKIAPDGKSMELAVPKAALGAGVEQIAVLADINDSVFLPNNFGYGGYTIAVPVVSAFDGLLTEWSQSQRLETPATQVAGYELYGAIKDGNFVIALKSDISIGSGTTFWLNTDGNTTTGHQVFGFAVGAEFNVNFGEDGRARLYTGDAGQTFVADLDFAIGPDGKTLELAIPKGLLGNVNSVGVMADVNDVVHLPADYTYPAYTIAEAPPVLGPTTYKIAIVYSQTTAGAYFSEMAYSQLVMAAQSQAMSAGIPFDLIGESDLTNLAKLSQYSALVFPSFRNVPTNYAEIATTLQTLIHDYGVSLIAAGDFMTNAANDASLPGNAYERMQSLFGLTRSGGDSNVNINLVTTGTNDITAGYTDGSIRDYTGASTSYFTTTPGQSGTVFAQQVVNGTAHDAVVSTTTGGRNVHFATDGMLADNNLLGQALDWATQTAGGPQVSLSMSRDSALVASRNDMDQSQETYDVDGGIYDAMLPILEQWKAQYNFVGSYYINVGLNNPDQTTNWLISGEYYEKLLAMGNEIGSHSYTHPHDTNVLLADVITDAELDAYVLAMSDLLSPSVLAALDQMSAAQFMARLQSSLLAPDPLVLDSVSKAVLEASYTFQFLHARQAIEANLGIISGGAAVPGMPETIETAREIIKYYDYLSGGASMIGAGYPGAFGFLTPNETDKVYIAPNMSFDFTLMGWLGLTPEEAKAKWLAEFEDLTINADLPILVWPWHDYGPTSWDIDGNGAGSNYTLAMFTSFLEAAYAKGAEFVTLADLAARISTFEKAEMSYKVNGDTITVTATPQLGTLGTFAVNLDSLGTQKIASVTNWYAYDGDSVFLDADGGAFEIKLGAAQADVTRIISIGARIQLLSLTGDGVNLSFSMYGEGLVKVDLAELAGYDFNISGAQVVNRTGDIVTLKLPTLGTHSVSLVRQDMINVGPTGIEVSNQVVVNEVMVDRIKVADLLVLDPNIHAHLRNNTVTVSDSRFEIDPVDGALYRKAGVAFDFETEPQITITITASDGQFTPVTKTIVIAVGNVNEAPTGAVLITGETVENQTLVADLSTLGDPDGMGAPSYQWQRDTGSGFVDIAGATGGSYTLTDADSFNQVRVVVSYTDAGGTLETVASAPTTPITDVNNLPTGAVTLSGETVENQTLTADASAITDRDGLGTFTYQWQRSSADGFVDIAGATGQSYTLTDADSFNQVRVVVSYTDVRGAVESVTSEPTPAITDVNNAPTGGVSITGQAIENQTLSANTTLLADADGLGALSYQWQRDTGSGFADITGATSANYTLTDADSFSQVRLVVSYTDARGAIETVFSTPTASVADVNNAPIGAVVIAGTVEENQTLTADTSALVDADGIGAFSYQWQREVGGAFSNIAGATSEAYTLTDADSLLKMRVVVSYTDARGAIESVASAPTQPVVDVNNLPVGAVTISGNTIENQTLTANAAITDADGLGVLSYQWQRDTGSGFVNISGATGATYTLKDADSFASVRVAVSYTDARGAAERVVSAATPAITDVNNAPTGGVSITGQAIQNQTLAANTAALADADGLGALSYQWQRDSGTGFANIVGATSANYTLTNADSMTQVRLVISYVDARGMAETVTSAPTSLVANINSAPTGSVTIVGKAIENETLTVNTATIADADGLGSFSYQWQRSSGSSFVNIAGATASSYMLVDADASARIRVVVSYTDARGTLESLTSSATTAVTDVLPAVVMAPLIEDMTRIINPADLVGAAYAGKTYTIEGLKASSGKLTANADGTWTFVPALNDDTGVTFSYSVKSGGVTKLAVATLDLLGMGDVMGTEGNDTLLGKATADQYHGLAGNDIMYGGGGNDIFFGGAGDDTIYGEAGNDIAFGGAGMDRFVATLSDGNDTYDGGTNVDTIDFSAITAAVTVDLEAGTSKSSQTGTDVLISIENVVGGKGNDMITGSKGVNVLDGGDGNDTIRGGAGNDTIYGGAGDDLLYGDAGNDKVYGGAGNDTFFATVGDGNDLYDGGAGTDTFNFAAISANVNVNLLTGKASSTQTGSDTLTAIENIIGGSGNDTIVGSSGANVINGGAGNDRIEGHGGRDILTGGAGSDIFIFREASHSGATGSTRDVITDFTKGVDKIDLSGIDANLLKSGNQAFTLLTTAGASFTGAAGQLRFALFDEAGTANDRTVIIGDLNGDKVADFMIELSGLVRLTAADFIL